MNEIQKRINELNMIITYIKFDNYITQAGWNKIAEAEAEIKELKKQLPKEGVYIKLGNNSWFTGHRILSHGYKDEACLFDNVEEALAYLRLMDSYKDDLEYEIIPWEKF